MTDKTPANEEITEADELALEQQFREQEALLAGLNAVPGLDAQSVEVAKVALERQRRLLAAYRKLRAHEAALGSTNRMLIEEDRRSVREKLELLAAFVDPAKRLVRDPTQPLYDSDIDEFRAALDKFERSGLVL